MRFFENDFECAMKDGLLFGSPPGSPLFLKSPLPGQKAFLTNVPFLAVQVEGTLFGEPVRGDGGH